MEHTAIPIKKQNTHGVINQNTVRVCLLIKNMKLAKADTRINNISTVTQSTYTAAQFLQQQNLLYVNDGGQSLTSKRFDNNIFTPIPGAELHKWTQFDKVVCGK